MLPPEIIDLLQNKEPFRLSHQTSPYPIHLIFLHIVGLADFLMEKDLHFRNRHIRHILNTDIFQEVNKFLHLIQHFFHIPFFGRKLRIDVGLNNFIHPVSAIDYRFEIPFFY
jgi:hypothetical protein